VGYTKRNLEGDFSITLGGKSPVLPDAEQKTLSEDRFRLRKAEASGEWEGGHFV